MVSVLAHAFSRGSSHISSADPKARPVIDPRYLTNPIDLELLANGVLFMQKIAETKPFADLLKDNPDGQGKIIQPIFKIDGRLDKAKAIKLVKNSVISSWHPIGTCVMLPRGDGGVVDGRLRVYGVRNLGVVDASIMPLHIRGIITSPVYAIAEKAADMIKEDLRVSRSCR
jgi:choline dehydrogenase